MKVVAAYPQGSKDIVGSTSRVPEYTEKVKALGVEIVDSIDELLLKTLEEKRALFGQVIKPTDADDDSTLGSLLTRVLETTVVAKPE